MTDRNIEDSIRKAVNEVTPDILEDLMGELGLEAKAQETVPLKVVPEPEERPAVSEPEKTPARKKWYRAAAGLAAVFALFIGYSMFGQSDDVGAVVGLDVNPSIELSVDKDGKVVKATAVNEEGEQILQEMDIKENDVSDACNIIVDKLVDRGYLTTKSNAVLVSVRSKDAASGRALEEELSGSINTHLSGGSLEPAIVGQYVEETEDLDNFAGENGISVGKANLIKSIMAAGTAKATEESLVKLSTQELVVLGQSRDVAGDVTYGTADTSSYVSKDSAKAAALAAAGISEAAATGMEVEFDCEDGVMIYEVEFRADGKEYEYEVNATTGEILKSEAEADNGDSDVDDDQDDDDPDDDTDDDTDDDQDDDPDDDTDDDDDDNDND